ncbi:MAG: hypothetical protein WC859_01855 [Elusimicrobiota bacterium]|jgi:hypothetical protein
MIKPFITRLFPWAFLLLLGSLLTAMIFLPLSWGLMDDAQTLQLLKTSWKDISIVGLLHRYSVNVIFRPVYIAYLYLCYGTFSNSPKLFYLFTLILVGLFLWPWTLILRRQLPPQTRSIGSYFFGFLLLASTPLYNLIVFLSLQEKFVIGFGGWALYALTSAQHEDRRSVRWWLWQCSGFTSFLLGVLAKPTTLAVAPWAFVSLVSDANAPKKQRAVWILAWATLSTVMGLVFLKRSDSYTSRYSTDIRGLVQSLGHQPTMVYLMAGLILVTILLIFLDWTKQKDLNARLARFLWPCSLACYLALLIPWGIATYLWAPAMVMACGCIVLNTEIMIRLWPRLDPFFRNVVLPMSILMAAGVVFHVAIPRLSRQAEIGTTVRWLSSQWPDKDIDAYIMSPCTEAATALEIFTGNTQQVTVLNKGEPVSSTHAKRWLITRDECPIDTAHAAQFTQIVFELPHWKIYEARKNDNAR